MNEPARQGNTPTYPHRPTRLEAIRASVAVFATQSRRRHPITVQTAA